VVAAGLLRRRQAAARRGRAAREEFARRLIESQEHERKRIAGELHDSLGQELLVVKNRALLALKADGLNDAARAQLEQISAVASRSLEGVRGLAHHLSPYQLEHLGLTSALKTMIEAVADTAGIPIDATVENVDGLLPREREINLYRIVQEGLSNVVHHAEASRTLVHVRGEERRIAVTIADDGRGFRVERDHRGRLVGGFGLSGIAERARILGGEVNVVSAPGEGTRLELSVPVAHHPFDGGMSHAPGADS
jgi:signal transduction histidine kinase